jgi:beta-galactosidase GanA
VHIGIFGAFEEKIVNFANNNAMAMMEGQVFNSLKLGPGKTLEDYHSQIIEKGTSYYKNQNMKCLAISTRLCHFCRSECNS